MTLYASKAYYGDSFTSTFYKYIFVSEERAAIGPGVYSASDRNEHRKY
jgi:hypothetical protein